jgi:hypothetical protein
MNAQNQLNQSFRADALGRNILAGAGIALGFTLLFLGFMWIVFGSPGFLFPLLVPVSTVTMGGAAGGLAWFLLGFIRGYGGFPKFAAIVFGGLVYIVTVWLSLVFGLAMIGLWD